MGFDWVGPDLVFGGMTTFFIITGILSLKDAAAGGQVAVAFDLRDYDRLFDQFRVAGLLCLKQTMLPWSSAVYFCFHLMLFFPHSECLAASSPKSGALLLAPTQQAKPSGEVPGCNLQAMLAH